MADERFSLPNFIVDGDKAFIQANLKELKQLSVSTYTVPPMHAYRLDLISHTIYGHVNMKMLLIYINDIIDVSMVKTGFVMKYPSIKDILSVLNETSEYID